MKRIWAALVAVLVSVCAHAQTNVKIIYTATPAATAWLNNNGGLTANDVSSTQTANTSAAFTRC